MGISIRECRTVEDFTAWDRFLYDYPGAHYFQTYGWLKSYEPLGLTTHVLLVENDGAIEGGVAFLKIKLPLLPYHVFIVPHGPLPAHPDAPSWLPLMERLDATFREGGAIYAQMYPHEISDRSVLVHRLEALGFTSPPLFTSHDFSSVPVLVDIAERTEEDLMRSFRQRTSRYIREALRSELTLRTDVSPALFDQVYELLSEHAQSRGFQPRPHQSLRISWDWFSAHGWSDLIQAWHGDTLVGANMAVFTGRTAYYLQGAVHRDYAEHRPAEFLHWHTIRRARERQLSHYDMVNLYPAGVEQFKRGFRPTCLSWHPPRAKVYRPLIARTVNIAERHLRPVIRRLARSRASAVTPSGSDARAAL